MLDFDLIVVAQPTTSISFDIIFIHGLGGDPRDTWLAPDGGFWPEWLVEAFPRARVLLLQYPTSQLGTLFGGTAFSFVTAAAGAADALRSNGVGIRPAIFIAHSLGGVVAKAFLRSCQQSTESSLKRIYDRAAGMVFFGTPNTGSSFASVASKFPKLISSMQTMEIGRGDAMLLELSTWYKGNAPRKTRAFYETLPMGPALVVDAGSANPGIEGCDPVPIARNHVSMCKFEQKSEAPYKSVLSFIKDECELGTDDYLEPDDLDYYLESIDSERRSLDEKLIEGDRETDVVFAKREKERVAKIIRRNILFQSAKVQYKRSLGEINSRFRLHVTVDRKRGQQNRDQ